MTLYYTPADELGPMAKGDYVEMMDRDMKVLGEPLRVVHVGKRHVRTDCGRRWTLEYGEWISDMFSVETRSLAAITWPKMTRPADALFSLNLMTTNV